MSSSPNLVGDEVCVLNPKHCHKPLAHVLRHQLPVFQEEHPAVETVPLHHRLRQAIPPRLKVAGLLVLVLPPTTHQRPGIKEQI